MTNKRDDRASFDLRSWKGWPGEGKFDFLRELCPNFVKKDSEIFIFFCPPAVLFFFFLPLSLSLSLIIHTFLNFFNQSSYEITPSIQELWEANASHHQRPSRRDQTSSPTMIMRITSGKVIQSRSMIFWRAQAYILETSFNEFCYWLTSLFV